MKNIENIQKIKEETNRQISTLAGEENSFTMLFARAPFEMNKDDFIGYEQRYQCIRNFLDTTNQLVYECLREGKHPELYRLIFFGKDKEYVDEQRRWYSNNPNSAPYFFRTDEPIPGVIAEIQCPGSGLAQLGILEQAWNKILNKNVWPDWKNIVINNIHALTKKNIPRILYLPKSSCTLDASLFYRSLDNKGIIFVNPLEKGIEYKNSINKNILEKVDMIRVHSHGFMRSWPAFWEAVQLAKKRQLVIDVPPAIIYNMKLSMALPFWSYTRNYYNDEIRQLFPLTRVIKDGGTIQFEGKNIKYEDYLKLPDKKRNHIIKSSSGTSELDDGGKGVFSLKRTTRKKCAAMFKKIILEYHYGERWIIQEEHNQKYSYSYLNENEQIKNKDGYARFSGFYGPDGIITRRVLFKNYYKVGGSASTVCAPVKIDD